MIRDRRSAGRPRSRLGAEPAARSGDIVVSSRVRLARNLQGYPFPGRSSVEDRARVLETVRTALGEIPSVPDIDFWRMEDLDVPRARAAARAARRQPGARR